MSWCQDLILHCGGLWQKHASSLVSNLRRLRQLSQASDIPPRQPEHYGSSGINFRLARGQTEFDDDVDVDVAGMGQIDRRVPLSLSEMLIVTLPCIIPFVDVKCSMVAWHT